MKRAYGIDFGTTNSTIAVVDSLGNPQTLPIDTEAPNPNIMRSITYIHPEGKILYGKPAIDAYLVDVAQGKGRISKTIFTGRMIKVSADSDLSIFLEMCTVSKK